MVMPIPNLDRTLVMLGHADVLGAKIPATLCGRSANLSEGVPP